MKPKPKHSSKSIPRRGFTLIELLIVITIIIVLAAVVVPVASNMREGANRTKCLSQFKNWGNVICSYAADNNGKYEVYKTYAVSYSVDGCSPYIQYWSSGIQPNGDNYEATPEFERAVALQREMRNCPCVKGSNGSTPVTITFVTPASGVVAASNRPVGNKDLALSIITKPSRFMMIVETIPGSTGPGYTAIPSQFATKVKPLTQKGPLQRHNGIVNALMADFSVRSLTWKEVEKGLTYWNVP